MRVNGEGMVYKHINDMAPLSKWDALKKLCQVFIPVRTKVHAATQIHPRPQAANKI